MSKQKSFLQCWLFVCWLPVVGALLAVRVQTSIATKKEEELTKKSLEIAGKAREITAKPQSYISLAKLVAGGRMVKGTGEDYQDYLHDFYGTIIEIIESSEMRRRALDRMRALHPDFKETKVEIKVSQKKGSAIFTVRAIGTEPKYTRIFLDALLDEFIGFRNQIRESQRNKALTTLAEDVVRREKSLNDKEKKLTEFEKANYNAPLQGELERLTKRALRLRDERDDLSRKLRDTPTAEGLDKQLASAKDELARVEAEVDPLAIKVASHEGMTKDYEDSKRAYNEILDLVRRFTVGEDMTTDHVTIMERASGAIEDLQDWRSILGDANDQLAKDLAALKATRSASVAPGGGLAGFVLSLLIAALIRAASARAGPPSLPAGG